MSKNRTESLTQTVWAVDGETHEDDIRVRIRQRPQSVVVLLSCCVPQGELHLHQTSMQLMIGRYSCTFKVHTDDVFLISLGF